MTKKALITGITGQDGAYLAELLLNKGYIVVGTFRRVVTTNFWRIEELGIRNHPNLHLEEFDLTDMGSAIRLIQRVEPDEIYNLAAQSFVGVSFDQPSTTSQITGIGVLNLLEAIRIVNPKMRFYQGIDVRDVRQGSGNPTTRDHAILAALALWRCQALRSLDDHQLP